MKIFQPFLTTKPTGQGTGLGLLLSYDIAKALGGDIKVETKEAKEVNLLFNFLYHKTKCIKNLIGQKLKFHKSKFISFKKIKN